MMKPKMIVCAVMLMGALQLMASQQLTLKEITSGAFRAEAMAAVEPLSDGETYAQISADGQQIVKYSFKTGKPLGILFDTKTVRGPKVLRVDGYTMSPDGRHILIQTQTKRIYRRSFTATYYIYNIQNNKMVPLSEYGPQQSPIWSPDGNVVAFVRNNNIFLVKLLYDNSESQVTTDGRRNEVINGVPDWVYEEEFSTSCSMTFTANSEQLVWIRYDESQVEQYSMQLFKQQMPSLYTYKYPVPGAINAKVKVLSYDIKSHQTRTMGLPLDDDGYIPRLKATTDPQRVVVVTMNRHQNDLKLYLCNPLSTVCQQIIEDKDDCYVKEEVLENLIITDKHVLLTSERSGYNQIYVYNLNGQLMRQIGRAGMVVTKLYGIDEQTGDVYFSANPTGPTDQQVMVSRKNGKMDTLTPKAGMNSAVFSTNFHYFINLWSDLNTPPVYSLCQNSGRVLATLIDNQALGQKLAQYDLGSRELFNFTTPDGTQLNGWMVKPRNFNPQKKYPVLMYQYGGPGSQQVLNRWDNGMNGSGAILEMLLAQEGYVVCCVDNRGTGGRGAEFEKCTYLKLGVLEAHDQVETAIWIGQQPWADKERIGIWGWSFGGFNTLMAMSEGRPVFRCGIAIAPPTNWRFYDSVYTERYMRTPKENQSGYDENPISRARQLNGSLLICHGLADDNVHYQNTAEYVEALVQADKDFSQLVYTDRNHSINGGNTRNHLFRQCMNFLHKNLK